MKSTDKNRIKSKAKHHFNLLFTLVSSVVLTACSSLSTNNTQSTDKKSTLPISPSVPLSKNTEIVIIGAGVSGLSAGKYLQDKGYQPIILEAQSKVGGRLKTDRSTGIAFDEGASWIHHPDGNPITPIAKKSGATTYFTDDDNVVVYDIDGHAYSDKETESAERKYYRKLRRLNGGSDTSFSQAFYQQFPQYQDDRLWTYMLSAFLEFDTGGDIHRLSSQGFYDDKTFDGEDLIITNGYDNVANYLAKELDIRLNTRINAIDYTNDKIEISTNNGTYQADKVLITVPLGVLKKGVIDFKPTLPNATQRAIDGLQMGAVNKFLLVWDKQTLPTPFWEDDLQYIGFSAEEKGKFNYFMNLDTFADPALGKYALMTFAFGDYSKQTEQMTDEEVIAEIMNHLQAIYGEQYKKDNSNQQPLPKPTEFLRTKWNENPNSYGAYSFSTVGISNRAFETFEQPIDNKLYFAGEHTIRDYRGTVHGAYLSGIREAKKILNTER